MGVQSHPHILTLMDTSKTLAIHMQDGGMNLKKAFESKNYEFPAAFIYALMLDMIKILKELNEKGIVHANIQPSKFVMRPKSDGSIDLRIIDFKFANFFQDKTKKHIKYDEKVANAAVAKAATTRTNLTKFAPLNQHYGLSKL